MKKFKIKSGDKVRVISGADKGKEGVVLKKYTKTDRVLVEKVRMVKRHTKPSSSNPQGGIIEKESPIHISNVMIIGSDGKTTRIGYRIEDDKKVRYEKKTNKTI